MNAIARFQEMVPFLTEIANAGYKVVTLQDGTLEVQDPVRVNGVIEYYDTYRLYTPKQARKFINDRS